MPTSIRRGLVSAAVAGGALSMAATIGPAVGEVAPGGENAADGESVPAAASLDLPAPRATSQTDEPAEAPAPPSIEQVPRDDGTDFTELVEAIEREQAERAEAERAEREAAAAESEQQAATDAVQAATDAAESAVDEVQDITGAAGSEESAAEEASSTGSANCGLDTSGLGPVEPWVRAAAQFLGCQFGQPAMIGVTPRSGPSDHPQGEAVDFMVDRATGNALAACALANMEALDIKYVIWRQRINFGNGWEWMADRGGATANHYDHVHISFESTGGGGNPQPC